MTAELYFDDKFLGDIVEERDTVLEGLDPDDLDEDDEDFEDDEDEDDEDFEDDEDEDDEDFEDEDDEDFEDDDLADE